MAFGDGYLFGGTTNLTYDQLERRRELSDKIAAQITGQQPKTAMAGVGAVLAGLGAGINRRRVDQEMDSRSQSDKSAYDRILDTIMGGSGSANSPATGSPPSSAMHAAIPSVDGAGNVPPTQLADGDVYNGFMGTVGQQVKNPYALAAVAATGQAESSFSPKLAGSSWADPSASGQQGTSGGTMSWRGPRLEALQSYAASKGEQGNGSPQTQAEFFLHEDPSLIDKLNNAGSTQEAQQLMNNAWAFKGYKSQGGESARRLAYANSFLPRFQGQQPGGTQVASLDPSAGMSQDPAAIAATLPQAPINGQQPYRDPQVNAVNAPRQMRAGQPVQSAAGIPGMVPAAQPQQMAAAGPQQGFQSRQPAPMPMPQQQQMAQNNAPSQPHSPFGGISPQVLQLMNSPFLGEGERATLRAYVQQQMQYQQNAQEEQQWRSRQDYTWQHDANDPDKAIERQYKQAQLDAIQHPVPKFNTISLPDGTVLQADDRGGAPKVVYQAQPKPTSDMQNYDAYAADERSAGRTPISRLEYETTLKGAGHGNEGGYYGSTVNWYDNAGNMHVGQLGKDGNMKDLSLPQGSVFAPTTRSVDTGTQSVQIGPGARELSRIDKDNEGKARQEAVGTGTGKQIADKVPAGAALGSTLSGLDRLAASADDLANDDYLNRVTGWEGMFPNAPGGHAASAQARLNTLKSQVGFNVLQAMREASKTGGALGSVSDKENELLQNNLAALDQVQSEDDLRKQLRSISQYVAGAMDLLIIRNIVDPKGQPVMRLRRQVPTIRL